MSIQQCWIDLLHAVATGTKKTRTLLTPFGVIVFGVFTSLFVLSAIAVDKSLNLPKLLPEEATLLVSLPVIVFGVAITAWSAIHFVKVKGTPVPFNPPPRLVRTGPYRLTRNPMLTGVFLLLFGIGIGLNSASLVFVFMPLYVLVNVWELRNIEEPELLKRLGNEYIEYRSQTPMFVPRWKTNVRQSNKEL